MAWCRHRLSAALVLFVVGALAACSSSSYPAKVAQLFDELHAKIRAGDVASYDPKENAAVEAPLA